MDSPIYSDKEIVTAIRKGGKVKEDMAKYLFSQFQGYIYSKGIKFNLPEDSLKDAYTDSVVKLISQISENRFQSKSKLSTYFYSIFTNKCIDVSRSLSSNKNKATEELEDYSNNSTDLLHELSIKQEFKILKNYMSQLGGDCKTILIDWGYYGYSMQEIAKSLNLASAESARSIKYKCLKKLRELIAQKPNNGI